MFLLCNSIITQSPQWRVNSLPALTERHWRSRTPSTGLRHPSSLEEGAGKPCSAGVCDGSQTPSTGLRHPPSVDWLSVGCVHSSGTIIWISSTIVRNILVSDTRDFLLLQRERQVYPGSESRPRLHRGFSPVIAIKFNTAAPNAARDDYFTVTLTQWLRCTVAMPAAAGALDL